MRKLKIAVFCTNELPTPPPKNMFYAPLWIAYYVAEGLAEKGHKIFYFGSKESKLKKSKLIDCGMPAIKYNKELLPLLDKLNESVVNFYEQLMISEIYRLNRREKFDLIHIHPYRRCIPLAALFKTPTAITLHDPLTDFKKYQIDWTKKFPQIHLISISNAQRKPSPRLNYSGTAYNGIDEKNFPYSPQSEDYFAIAGRFTPEKGIHTAIQAAKKAGVRLKIAGGPDKGAYFDRQIKPFLNKKIEYVGMIDYDKLGDFYGQAKGFLVPIQWEEPFGLTFIEAMACGTPVITFNRGSAREIIKDKKTGYVVKNLDQMVKAMKKIDRLKRSDCRQHFENNFTINKMVESYEKIFLKIAKKS